MREKLTKKDVEKIEQEIEHRKLVVRKEAIEAVKEARARAIKWEFEYYAAKRHKNQNESRIRYLENMLKTATIVSDKSSSDEVGMDDIVRSLFEEDDEIENISLLLPSGEIPWRTESVLTLRLAWHWKDIRLATEWK